MRSLYIRFAASVVFVLCVRPARAQLLPSQAKGAAQAQVVMLSVNDKGCAAGIIVGYDENAIYVATAAHITDLTPKPLPPVAVRFEGLLKSFHIGKFLPQFETKEQGDLAVVSIDRNDEVNKFLDELDFAVLSPIPLAAANTPVMSIGCSGGAYWSSGTNETLLTRNPTQGYLQIQSDVSEGQSGGGLYNEAWELIGMPLDVSANGVYARPIDEILTDLRKWGVPIRLSTRPLKDRARGTDEIARERAARELVLSSVLSMQEDPERGLLLAMHAVVNARSSLLTVLPEAEAQLHRAIWASHIRRRIPNESETVEGIAWSPDGKRLATAGFDNLVKVWDADTGKELLHLVRQSDPVMGVAWSPDGRRLATASNVAKVWDADTGEELLNLSGHSRFVNSVAWSSDGRYLATASDDKMVKVWDAATGKQMLNLVGHSDRVRDVAWSPDGRRLATASFDDSVKVWDATTGRVLLSFSGYGGVAVAVAWNPDGKRLATGGADRTGKVLDATTGKLLITLYGHSAGIESVSWSPDGKRIATGSAEQSKVWDGAAGRLLVNLLGPARCITWSPDGRLLATPSYGSVNIWNAEAMEELLTFSGHDTGVRSIAWSPDGKQFATASDDKTGRVWDAVTGRRLLSLSGHRDAVRCIVWSPDGKRLLTGSDDGTAKIWDAAKGNELLSLSGHSGAVLSVAWSVDGNRMATGGRDGTARVWNAATGKELVRLSIPPHLDSNGKLYTPLVRSVAWNPDGKRLATGSEDAATVWDWAVAKQVRGVSDGWSQFGYIVAWNPDGEILATLSGAGWERTTLWHAATGRQIFSLSDPTSRTLDNCSFVWSPNAKRIATGDCTNGNARVWDASTGEELLRLSGHDIDISVAWSPDAKRLATADNNGVVRVYAVDIDLLLAIARKRITRDLTTEECKAYLHVDRCPLIP